jgi:hypothetical protein
MCSSRSAICSASADGSCSTPPAWTARTGRGVHAQLRLIDAFDFEIDTVSRQLRARLCHDPGYLEIQRIPGVGPVLAAVFVAEIGEAGRFRDAAHLASWAGLTPKHRESDTTVRRGPITKQGSGLVRWAAVEAARKIPASAGWLVSDSACSHRAGPGAGPGVSTGATGQPGHDPEERKPGESNLAPSPSRRRPWERRPDEPC